MVPPDWLSSWCSRLAEGVGYGVVAGAALAMVLCFGCRRHPYHSLASTAHRRMCLASLVVSLAICAWWALVLLLVGLAHLAPEWLQECPA